MFIVRPFHYNLGFLLVSSCPKIGLKIHVCALKNTWFSNANVYVNIVSLARLLCSVFLWGGGHPKEKWKKAVWPARLISTFYQDFPQLNF